MRGGHRYSAQGRLQAQLCDDHAEGDQHGRVRGAEGFPRSRKAQRDDESDHPAAPALVLRAPARRGGALRLR